MASALCNKASFAASSKVAASRPKAARAPLVVRAQAENAEPLNRRAALGAFAGAAALLASASPSQAAFGDSANVFGKITNKSGFVPYAGEGYALLLPSSWNPSKEQDFPGVQLRYEDNGDSVNNLTVIVNKTDKTSIDGYGAPEKFVENISYLLGKQTFSGNTISEGGFAPNRVSVASLLDVKSVDDKKGKKYYQYEFLTRTADGDEGGRHQLIKATVSNGNLYIFKVQVGDKRWFKGVKNQALGAINSFTVV